MDSDEEAFNKFIVTSDDDESSKENDLNKNPKTNQKQYDLMISFSEEMDEQKPSKKEYEHHWEKLADKLNKIGPPIRGSWEWRRVWSVYKYNQKRKQPQTVQAGKHRADQDPQHNVSSLGEKVSGALSFSDRILQSIGTQVLEKLDRILNILTDSNDLLKKSAHNAPRE